MFKIVIFMLLSAGVFSLSDQLNAEGFTKSEDVINDELEKAVNNPTEDPKPQPKKASPKLDQEQIKMLAEKVIRIHGVKLDSMDDENLKNIEHLKKVVASVDNNLNEKLKLTQRHIKEETNLNENNEAKETTQASEDSQNQNESVENVEENVSTVTNADVLETDDAESQNLHENIPETEKKDIHIDIETVEETVNKEDEIEVQTGTDDVEMEEKMVNVNEESQSYIEAGNPQNLYENIQSATVSDETGDTVEEENINYVDSNGIKEVVNSIDNNIPDNITENSGDNDDIISRTEDERANESEEDITNLEGKEDEIEKETDDGISENEEDVEQQDINNEDINDTKFVEENESNNKENFEEDDISGACSLAEGCDQTDNRKIHKYLEEYNSETINEQEIENKIEDTDFQRIIKYVTSFLN